MLLPELGHDGGVGAERLSDEPASEPPYDWLDAALVAEHETGRQEADERTATTSLLIRAVRIGAGAVVVLLGIALVPLPGPGLIVLAGGLSILAIDVPFARRLLQSVRARIPQDADGGTSRWVVIAMVGGVLIGLAGSAAYALG